MRLHELQYIPKKDSNSVKHMQIDVLDDYYDFLHYKLVNLGYKKLGDGFYGVAYEIPGKDYILKIYPLSDLGFSRWVELSNKHSNNPFMPKFYGKPMKVGNLCAIRMEKLSPCRESELSEIVSAMGYTYPIFKECIQKWPSNPGTDVIREYLETTRVRKWYRKIFLENVTRYYTNPKASQFWEVCEIIFNSGMACDVHSENIMKRGNQFVISDGLSDAENDTIE